MLEFQHGVFFISSIIANTIPNVPYQVDRQIALEKQLLKEHKYKNAKIDPRKLPADSYDVFLAEIRKVHYDDERGLGELVNRHSWVRRISRRISSNSLTTKIPFFSSESADDEKS